MKKIIYAAMLLLGLSIIIGCSKETDPKPEPKPQPEEKATLTVAPTSLTFENTGGSQGISITANKAWTISSSQSWCKVSQSSGNATGSSSVNITVTCDENTTYDERTCTLTIKAGTASQTVEIKQGEGLGLVISQTIYDVSNDAQTIEVEVKANVEYEYTIAEDAKDWITVSETKALVSSKVKFDIAANESYDERESVITFKQKDGSLAGTVTVKQGEEKGLIITKTSYELSDKEQTIEVEVKANVEYEYHIAEDAIDWITPVETKALVPSKVMFTIAANETYDSRSAEITIKSSDGSMSGTVNVTQMQKGAIIVAKDLYEFDRSGGELTVEVNHSIEFDVETSDEWITEVTTKALTTTTETFFIAKNDSGKEREGAITFKSKDGAVSQCITIKQGIVTTIVTSDKSIIFENCGGSASVEINPNVNFDFDVVYPDNTDYDKLGWISVSSIREPRIHLNINTNTSYDRRRALLIVKDVETEELDTVKIFVKQQEYLEAETTVYELPYTGGDCIIHFNSSYDYEIEIPESATWLKRVDTKAIQSHTVTLYAEENKDDSSRETVVKVSLQDGTLYKNITIKQYGKVYQGDYTINSHDDVIYLRDIKIKKIDGNLHIYNINTASDLNNLITDITGDLIASSLTNFDGLYGLRKIGGNLEINGHSEGLNNLEEIKGRLSCFADADLSSLKKLCTIGELYLYKVKPIGMSAVPCHEIKGTLYARDVPSFEGLEAISTIGGFDGIAISSFAGLSGLKVINGDFIVTGGALKNFKGLDNLESIFGSFMIQSITNCYDFDYDGLIPSSGQHSRFYSYPWVFMNNLESFSGLSNLKSIGGDFKITSDIDGSGNYSRWESFSSLKCLGGLSSLTQIGGNFNIYARSYTEFETSSYSLCQLESIDIPSLSAIGGKISIESRSINDFYSSNNHGYSYCLTKLTDISMSNLSYLGEKNISIVKAGEGANMPSITKANSKITELKDVNFNTDFSSNDDGFTSLKVLNGDLATISGIGFPALEIIKGSFECKGGRADMPKLNKVLQDFTISGVDEDNFMSLLEVGGTMTISSSKSVSCFSSLTKVGQKLQINDCMTLSDISGLKNIRTQEINIENCPSLYDFSPLVPAVESGASWYVNKCGYNPTKYQMQNGESKPE